MPHVRCPTQFVVNVCVVGRILPGLRFLVINVDGSAGYIIIIKLFSIWHSRNENKACQPSEWELPPYKPRNLNDYETILVRRTQFLQFQADAEASTQYSAPRLTDLPTDMLLHIFSWLPKRDVMSVASVCKCYEVSNDSSLWRALTFTGSTSSTQKVQLLLRKSPGLRYLEVAGRTDATAVIKQVCRSNGKLRTLVVKRCFGEPQEMSVKDAVICNLPKRCKELESLTIEDTYIKSTEFCNSLGQTLPNFKKDTSHCAFWSFGCTRKKLR